MDISEKIMMGIFSMVTISISILFLALAYHIIHCA